MGVAWTSIAAAMRNRARAASSPLSVLKLIGSGHEQDYHQHVGTDEYGLRVEKVGDDENIAERAEYVGIAQTATLHQLHTRQHGQQGDPGIASEKCPVAGINSGEHGGAQENRQPLRRQRHPARRIGDPPARQGGKARQHPGRNARRMGDHDQRQAARNPKGALRRQGPVAGFRIRAHYWLAASSYRASACRHRCRCDSPLSTGMSTPGRQSP